MNPMALVNQIIENGLDKDPRIMALLNCIIRNPDDKGKIDLLNRLASPKILYNQMFGKPFKETDETVNGLIKFAYTENSVPVGINPDEPHALIAGQTGSGKSILLMIMLGQVMLRGATIWLFAKAKDVRNLLNLSREIIVVDFCGQTKFNPLLSPGVDVKFWINCFSDVFIQAFGLYDGTKNFLLHNIDYLFTENNLPTILDLYRLIKAQKFPAYSRYARYQESAINRLGGMITSLGRVFDYPCIPLEELAKRNVIFEIQGLTSEQQVFVVNILLTWLFYYRLYHNNTGYHFVGIDDANLVFDKSFEHRPDRGLPIISHLVSTVRKSKVNVFVASQIPHQLGSSIHANSYTKIMFGLADGRDVDCMVSSMGIRDSEQLQYCHRLGKREIVVKFSGRYQEPFLAYIPEVPYV